MEGVRSREHFRMSVEFLLLHAAAVAELRDHLIVAVDDRHLATELRHVEMAGMLIQATRNAHVGHRPLVFQIERVHLEPAVGAVGDVNLGFLAERADPNAVARLEFAVFRTGSADRLDVLEVFVEAIVQLTTGTVDDVDVAVGSDRHVGRVRKVERLRRAAGLHALAEFVEHLAGQIGLVERAGRRRSPC